jgi:L,D-peptidoglycan transpeptidase YkuD (ErfK/YbiS/YcfS/YnhG family)
MEELNSSVKVIKSFIIIIYFTVLLALLSLTACVCVPVAFKFDTKLFLIAHENKIGKSNQVLLVIDNSSLFSTERKVHAFEKKGNEWKMAFEPFNAVIGRNGFAAAGEKREGDGKTPSGIYPLKITFGYDELINTRMLYRQALGDDIWIDDPNADDYNRWVKKQETRAASYERMKRDDSLYKYGIIIEYNTSPVIKGHGSAIFFHVWGGEDITTEGCVAVSEQDTIKILAWLDPQASPVIIMGLEN